MDLLIRTNPAGGWIVATPRARDDGGRLRVAAEAARYKTSPEDALRAVKAFLAGREPDEGANGRHTTSAVGQETNMQLSLIEDPAKLKPQAAQVLRVLRERGSISAREAMALSPPCYRLAARIMELREVGHRIDTERESHAGGSHARYRWLGR